MTLFELRNKLCSFDEAKKQWAYSLIGPEGLDNIKLMLETVEQENIKGDFVETGVWQGGACIYAKAIIDELKMDRTVFACDSYEGLPAPNVDAYPDDEGDAHHLQQYLKVSQEEVQRNFDKCEVKHTDVVFVKGWFKNTMRLVKEETKSISILRLDGDMYESTTQVLEALYDSVPVGGFVVIDDYCLPNAIKATNDFRDKRGIKNTMVKINDCIFYWRK